MGVLKEVLAAKGPAEVLALLRYTHNAAAARRVLSASLDPHWRFAYTTLADVSRSFSLVIMQLRPELRHAVCVFYLVLRALDTVEDDTAVDPLLRARLCAAFWTFLPPVPHEDHDERHDKEDLHEEDLHEEDLHKEEHLKEKFHKEEHLKEKLHKEEHLKEKLHKEEHEEDVIRPQEYQPWSSTQFGTGPSKLLCQRFPDVVQCFRQLSPTYQRIIAGITRRMGKGMANHIHDVSCDTVHDYDKYCHYVAGLVGYGLTDIFVQSDCEHACLSDRMYLSNSMGLFLQKTNIIRDYLEDIEEGRTFWPKEIWTRYGDRLEDFSDPANRKFSLAVLNHMVTDALRHIPHCLEYMSLLRSPDVFNFVAIPQVMAIATLAECYNNGAVFERVVKLRRSRTALLVLRATSIKEVYQIFYEYAHVILQRVERHDPNADATRHLLRNVVDGCVPHLSATPNLIIPNVVSIVLFCGLSSYVLKRRQDHFDGAVFTWRSAGGIMEPTDMLAVGALFLVCMYMFGFFLLPYMTKMQQEEWRRLQRQTAQTAARTDDASCPSPAVSLNDQGVPM